MLLFWGPNVGCKSPDHCQTMYHITSSDSGIRAQRPHDCVDPKPVSQKLPKAQTKGCLRADSGLQDQVRYLMVKVPAPLRLKAVPTHLDPGAPRKSCRSTGRLGFNVSSPFSTVFYRKWEGFSGASPGTSHGQVTVVIADITVRVVCQPAGTFVPNTRTSNSL